MQAFSLELSNRIQMLALLVIWVVNLTLIIGQCQIQEARQLITLYDQISKTKKL